MESYTISQKAQLQEYANVFSTKREEPLSSVVSVVISQLFTSHLDYQSIFT